MKKFCLSLIIVSAYCLFLSNNIIAQVSGTKTIPGDYTTITAAVIDLNGNGVGPGGVIYNITAGYTETITTTISLTATGTLANPIIFRKSGVGNNPLITAYTGTATPTSAIQDGIWQLVGADYVTIDGIDLYDPNTINPATMEYGYGMFKVVGTNGCQYNTIKNCVVTLSRNNNASATAPAVEGSRAINIMNAIATTQTTAVTITSAAGTNSYNKIYGNTLQNCNYGIAITGYNASTPFTTGDTGNDFGGTADSTGNLILNFGGATGATNPTAGIRANYQWSINISHNTINNNDGAGVNHPNIIRGIYGEAGTSANATISFNNVTIHGGGTTQTIYGIDNYIGNTAASNTVNIFNNEISGCTYSTATNGAFFGIRNAAVSTTRNAYNNKIINNIHSGTGVFVGLFTTSNNSTNNYCYGNLISDNSINTNSSGTMYGIDFIEQNTNYRYCYNNEIKNLSITGGATGICTIYGIYSYNITNSNIYNNKIHNLSISTGGIGNIYGIRGELGGSFSKIVNVYKNKVYSLSVLSDSTFIAGIYIYNGGVFNLYNNFIGDLLSPTANTDNPIHGISNFSSIVNAYYNTIYLNASSTGALFGSTAIYFTTASYNTTLCNNIIVNTSIPNGTGITAAYRRTDANLTTYGSTSNNNFLYAGTPGPNNLIYYDGVVTAQSLWLFKTTVAPRDSSSITSTVIPNFLSTTGADATYLHINGSIPSFIECGGKILSGYDNDYDGDIRAGSPGYPIQSNDGGAAPDIGADEFDGMRLYTCTIPNPGNTITTANSVCSGQNITLSLQTPTNGTGITYQWKSSPDGITYSNINGANQSTYNFNYSTSKYYKCLVTCLAGPSSTESIPLLLFEPAIISTTDGSRCGTGTVTLGANGSSGATLKWYAASVGGSSLGSGTSFITPTISTTTTYYVGAENYPPSNTQVTLGSGTSTNVQAGSTPYSSYYEGAREQYLVKGSELSALGLVTGNITSLAFNVSSSGSYAQKDFTIKMAHTANTSITGAYGTPTGSFTTVYTIASLSTPPIGWNTYSFLTPFYWDGTSNILVDICHDNDVYNNCSSCFGLSSGVYCTVTSFNSHFGSYENNMQNCGMTRIPIISVYYTWRVNMKFVGANVVPCSSTRSAVVAGIYSSLPASVSIAANPSNSICIGSTVTFTATPANGGTPSYQWKLNGTDITGATNSTYSSAALVNGDIITCVMTSSLSCATGNPATSNAITMVIYSALPASVSIASVPTGTICSGTNVSFTATPVNGGTPSFQWYENGTSISGATNSTYSSTTLVNGDAITCVMTSSLSCATGNPATSNAITMTVNPCLIPTITSFTPISGPIGTTVTISGTNFNATLANNIVFFGATMATVSAGSTTSLTVTVPAGATYQDISVTDITSGLTAYSAQPFITTFNCGGTIDTNSFSPKVDFTTGAQPFGVSLSDLDGDGKPDIVVTNQNSNTVSVFKNTSTSGTVSFAAKVDFTTGTRPYGVGIGDIDGDGKPDLAVSNYTTSTVSVFRNTCTTGNISFATKVDFMSDAGPYKLTIADFDGDGKPDISTGNLDNSTISLLRNTSSQGFISFAAKVDITTGVFPYGISSSDLDGDGKPELITANHGSGTISVFKNNCTIGNISFAAKVDFTAGTNPKDISVGDLDGDGKPDGVVANYGSNSVSVLKNISTIGNISFATKVDFATGSVPYGVSISDLDGDGKPDLAIPNSGSSTVSVIKNTCMPGTISFATKVDYTSGTSPVNISMGDLDGDGAPDLVVDNYGSNTVSVFRNIVSVVPPTPAITSISNYLHSSATTDNQWYLNNVIISGGTGQNYTPLQNGNYYVIVTVNGCSSDTSNIITVVTVGIEVAAGNNGIAIYPNPTKDKITIETTDNTKQQTISIFNMQGQLLLQQAMPQPKTEIDISHLAKGVYVIKLSSADGIAVRKFIKE